MRYKVTFKGEDPYEYFEAHNSKYSATVVLAGEDYKQFTGVIFNDGETKVFTLYPKFAASTETSDGTVAGETIAGETNTGDIEYAITVKNGEVDLQVKPFSYEITDFEWDVFDDAGYDYDNCGVILTDAIIEFKDKMNFTANGIKHFFNNGYIVAEEVED